MYISSVQCSSIQVLLHYHWPQPSSTPGNEADECQTVVREMMYIFHAQHAGYHNTKNASMEGAFWPNGAIVTFDDSAYIV